MRLSSATADRLPANIARGDYDRAAQRRGIVHLGIGAFHRAHQAAFTDIAMSAGDRHWMITGVSLRSAAVQALRTPQDGLFTVSERGEGGEQVRLVSSVAEVLVASEAPGEITRALASPDTRIATLTVTEKGYCRAPDGTLDAAALADGITIYHLLARAVIDRHDAGLAPLTLVSCDNVAENGPMLRAGLAEYLDRLSPTHRRWFEAVWACPSTMVDRIVPATTADELAHVAGQIGMRDEGAVVTEPFAQWVIEDRFAGPRPCWEAAGAQLVGDVRPFEAAKLRMLNGAHSALAYLGLERGHIFVHQAINDPQIRSTVEGLMRNEAAASLAPVGGQDIARYADGLLMRFHNPSLRHRLAQIATDGSQKIGPRWLEPIRLNRLARRSSPATLMALAAWIRHVRGDRSPVCDPLAGRLRRLWSEAGADGIVSALFDQDGMFSREAWQLQPVDRAALQRLL